MLTRGRKCFCFSSMYGERDISNHMVPEIRFDAKYKYEYVQLLNDDVLA